MVSKECFRCEDTKPIDQFYKHHGMRDGHLNKCIPCTKEEERTRRNANLDQARAYDRKRGSRQTAEQLREYRARHPEKNRARAMLSHALKIGHLERPEACSRCGNDGKIHGHHDDYSKPLDVMWLCSGCHGDRHRELNKVARNA